MNSGVPAGSTPRGEGEPLPTDAGLCPEPSHIGLYSISNPRAQVTRRGRGPSALHCCEESFLGLSPWDLCQDLVSPTLARTAA